MATLLTVRNDVRAGLRDYFSRFLKPGMKVYDVGCGAKPFKTFTYIDSMLWHWLSFVKKRLEGRFCVSFLVRWLSSWPAVYDGETHIVQ